MLEESVLDTGIGVKSGVDDGPKLTSHDPLVDMLAQEVSLEGLVGYLQVEGVSNGDGGLQGTVRTLLSHILGACH